MKEFKFLLFWTVEIFYDVFLSYIVTKHNFILKENKDFERPVYSISVQGNNLKNIQVSECSISWA